MAGRQESRGVISQQPADQIYPSGLIRQQPAAQFHGAAIATILKEIGYGG